MDEVENPVPSGVHAGNEVRPRDRTLGRDAGRQLPERALIGEAGEVWHLPFLHEFSKELRIHAVDANDNKSFPAARVGASALAGRQQNDGDARQRSESQPEKLLQTLLPVSIGFGCTGEDARTYTNTGGREFRITVARSAQGFE